MRPRTLFFTKKKPSAMPRTQFFTKKKTLTMLTTKQTIAQWSFERLYVAPFTQRRGFDERSLTYRMVPIEQARQLTDVKVLDTVVDSLIASAFYFLKSRKQQNQSPFM